MTNPNTHVHSVSDLARLTQMVLDDALPSVLVEGEISNVASPPSGHFYFSLKDDKAQVRCALFKGKASRLKLLPENGMQVLVRASISIYAPRGDFQLIIDTLEPIGDGLLQRQFEALKNALLNEGLFDQSKKKPLPKNIHRVGIITSPRGAAIRDIISVFARRSPSTHLIIYPCQVQGTAATAEIVEQINKANDRKECDVLLIARGGGSLEDLWCFNEEAVARAIYASDLPIITGVGHEVDTTIADFVSDLRAPTPSAGAELLSTDQEELRKHLQRMNEQLQRAMMQILKQSRESLLWLARALKHPKQKLQEKSQRVDELYLRLTQAKTNIINSKLSQINFFISQLNAQSPTKLVKQKSQQLAFNQAKLMTQANHLTSRKQEKLHYLATSLNQLSPLETIKRGYGVIHDSESNAVIDSVAKLTLKQTVKTKLGDGDFESVVTKVVPNES